MEHQTVVVQLYRMIEIDVDESAPALVEAVKEEMIEDGIWELAKKHLRSIVTDGASVSS